MQLYRFEDKGMGMMCRMVLVRAKTVEAAWGFLARAKKVEPKAIKEEYRLVKTTKGTPDNGVLFDEVIG